MRTSNCNRIWISRPISSKDWSFRTCRKRETERSRLSLTFNQHKIWLLRMCRWAATCKRLIMERVLCLIWPSLHILMQLILIPLRVSVAARIINRRITLLLFFVINKNRKITKRNSHLSTEMISMIINSKWIHLSIHGKTVDNR